MNDGRMRRGCSDVLDALGHQGARQVLYALRNGPLGTTGLSDRVAMSRSTLQRAMRSLLDAGLIEARKDGRRVRYHLVPSGLEAARHDLLSMLMPTTLVAVEDRVAA